MSNRGTLRLAASVLLLAACGSPPPALEARLQARSALLPTIAGEIVATLWNDAGEQPTRVDEATVPLGDFDLAGTVSTGGADTVTLRLVVASIAGPTLFDATETFATRDGDITWDVGPSADDFDTEFDYDGDPLSNWTEVFYGCDPTVTGDCAWLQMDAGANQTCAIRADRGLYCWGQRIDGPSGTPVLVSLPASSGSREWMQVSVGLDHVCGLARDRMLYCFGDNWGGQLGVDPDATGSTPIPVRAPAIAGEAFDRSWSMVSAGIGYACAIDAERALWCWGLNDGGQLGRPLGEQGFTAERVAAGEAAANGWTYVSAGVRHVCGLQGQELFCWGDNNDRQVDGPLATAAGVAVTEPRHIDGQYARVSAGSYHTCATLADGTSTVCWGEPAQNRLGAAGVPSAIHDTTYRSLQTGIAHTCGVTVEGALRCWGSTAYGCTGVPPVDGGTLPAPVTLSATTFEVATGDRHTCARGADGIRCFGNNARGQLGRDTIAHHDEPQQVGSASDWIGVAAGLFHTCAWSATSLSCFGRNDEGALGTGGHVSTYEPQPVLGAVSAVAAGADHTCAIAGGELRCWGLGGSGQSPGTYDADEAQPYARPGGVTWVGLSAGQNHGCAVAGSATPGDTLWCWGANDTLQLGRTCTPPCAIPLPVEQGGATTFTRVAAGSGHSCALDDLGQIWCFGDWPIAGATDLGSAGLIDATPTWAAVASGGYFTCAIHDGALWCAGDNDSGQLGALPSEAVAAFAPVAGVGATLTDWTTVVAGERHVCATRPGDELYCWGFNADGQLGIGSFTDTHLPTRVPGAWVSAAAGVAHTCAIDTGGHLWCWGDNSEGQLGVADAWDTTPVPIAAP